MIYKLPHSLVNGNADCVEKHPLTNVMVVHPDKEDDDKHQQHSPEFPAPPLRQSQFSHKLAPHILQLLVGSTGVPTFLRKRRSV